MHTCGYIGAMCNECKILIDEGTWRGDIVRWRRERLKPNLEELKNCNGLRPYFMHKDFGITIEEMATRTHHKVKTVKRYEQKKCPSSYMRETERLMKAEDKNG
jgi:hypothetical protein